MLLVTPGQSVRTKHLTAKEINSPLVLSCLSVNYQNVPSVGRLIIKVAPFFGIMQSLVWVLSLTSRRRNRIQPPSAPWVGTFVQGQATGLGAVTLHPPKE